VPGPRRADRPEAHGPRGRDWSGLAAGTQRRWTAVYGGRGTPEQRAARAARRYEAGAPLPREHTGHERERPAITGMVEPGAVVVEFAGLDRGERRRVARWNSLAAQLATGTLAPAEFQRRVARWRPVQGHQLSSDAAAVLARQEEERAAGEELAPYHRGRVA
jgi:hypothetical protein